MPSGVLSFHGSASHSSTPAAKLSLLRARATTALPVWAERSPLAIRRASSGVSLPARPCSAAVMIPAVGSLDRWLGRPSSSRGSSEPGAWAMVAVPITTGRTPAELRALARRERDGRVSARPLALANALDGMSRDQAARAAGMDRQTLRDWAHRYNAEGVEGLRDRPRPGRPCALDEGQQAALKGLILRGPRLERDGRVAWRARDLRELAERRVGGRPSQGGGRGGA